MWCRPSPSPLAQRQFGQHHGIQRGVRERLAFADLPEAPGLVQLLHLGVRDIHQEDGEVLVPVVQQGSGEQVGHALLPPVLAYAQEAMEKAPQDEPRPSWVSFYGVAELTAITAIVRDRIGDAPESEAASHQALAAIPKHFRRNRALATTQLALAQVHQREVEQACATAASVFELMSGNPIPGRLRSLLGDFYRDLITLAPDAAVAQEWGDRYRSEWSRA